jgi:hypothetical protein
MKLPGGVYKETEDHDLEYEAAQNHFVANVHNLSVASYLYAGSPKLSTKTEYVCQNEYFCYPLSANR